jgi:ElaB/YqjD/DUF883 family membrane-anchored ribosome-binding protein
MSSTSASGSGTPGGKTDFDTLKSDMKALREDLATLLKDTGSFAAQKAKDASTKGKELASDAGEKAIEFRDAVGDKVRQHPFAAVGIALAAGYIIASLSRRNS